jgi:hypothetical protein
MLLAVPALLVFVPSELTIKGGPLGTTDVRSFGTHY